MTPINKKLVEKEIITTDRVKEIKTLIYAEYEEASPKKKAQMVAKKIHEIIDVSVPNFSKESKKTVRMELIKRKLLANSLTINANDVLETSIEIATSEEIEQELPSWLKKEVELEEGLVDSFIIDVLHHYKSVNDEVGASSYIELSQSTKVETNQPSLAYKPWNYRKYAVGIFLFLLSSILIISISVYYETSLEAESSEPLVLDSVVRTPNELPSNLQYEDVDISKLQEFLIGRESMLADEPYFSTILEVADEFNVHPLLLFAITGQEQAFVPKHHQNSDKIANNPFNVFHSWEDFNTNILESSQIAARTVVNLSEGRPEDADPIQWINRKYAEDPNWWVGVSSIYRELENAVK